MAEFDHHSGEIATLDPTHDSAGVDTGAGQSNTHNSQGANGSSIHNDETNQALNQIDSNSGSGNSGAGDHNHAASETPLPRVSDDFTQHNGTTGSDNIAGGEGDDFIFPGEGTFTFATAEATSGAEEFPFPNPSQGSSQADLSLDAQGNFKVAGSFQNFDGAPLFSQGEQEIDPNATILNGSDPNALINGFLEVPEDVEGNPLSGSHIHFSPAGDDRNGDGENDNFADATVVRFLDNQVNADGKSGTISGEFELKPEEQAALLAGNLYVNLHSNVDADKDGKAGFPTGENRLNLNQNVVQFA